MAPSLGRIETNADSACGTWLDLPAPLGIAGEADDRAGPDPRCRRRLVAERPGDELEAVAGDLDGFPVRKHRFHERRRGLGDHGGDQPVGFARILEERFEHGVALGRIGGQARIGLGPAIAVTMVVIEDPAPHRGIGGLLVGAPNRRLDREALRIGVLAVGVEDDLPRHFGDELRMGGDCFAEPLANVERLRLRVAELRRQ